MRLTRPPRQELHERLSCRAWRTCGSSTARSTSWRCRRTVLSISCCSISTIMKSPQMCARAMNTRIFAALKRGGSYGVVDHSAKEGVGDSEAKTLHRMDKLLVIKEATGVGFRLAEEGKMLSRADDTRDFSVVKIRDKSDRFVLKFVKP